ncbi:MAG: aminotransferase class I/II-fold pyridoxal phosphate-dependent enzyme [Firmicutes bacterium]|nr:aminotransferase class I/II-fold pyridoxal phosphate-dependent enzyme [Bacillota bacterium]
MENTSFQFEKRSLDILKKALYEMEAGFENLPETCEQFDYDKIEEAMMALARRMRDNYPYFHPLYAGQMLKPPHPASRIAYMLSLWVNPNNHALDGGKASSRMEKEAVAKIAEMFGWAEHLGHLTGGGTMANLEALWISGRLHPGKKIIASEQAHYTHGRISEVLGIDFQAVPCNAQAEMDMKALRAILEQGNVGTVVATMGTTATGSVDPLPEILKLQEEFGFRIHADAAYGGYFTLAGNLGSSARAALDHLVRVDSIVIDPHKHGLQPYGCGCVIFRDPSVGRFYKHDSPYTYFTSSDIHLGEISLECSRPGAAAAALWAVQQVLPYDRDGEFARNISKCRAAAVELYEKIRESGRFLTIFPPELDITVWAPKGKKASEISALSERIFGKAEEKNLYLAIFRYPSKLLKDIWVDVEFDEPYVTCLRSCLMKPEHDEWIDRIWRIIEEIQV